MAATADERSSKEPFSLLKSGWIFGPKGGVGFFKEFEIWVAAHSQNRFLNS